ncbi:hypothetical protein FPOAC2_10522 [Fusarium poae]
MHITDEIWSYIFSHFECPMPRKGWHNDAEWTGERWERKKHDRDQLLALCLVNRQFRRIAQQLLHRSIPIRDRFSLRESSSSLSNLLIRTLHSNPTLAGNIRALKLVEVSGYRENVDFERALDHLNLEPSLASRLKTRLFCSGGVDSLLPLYTPQVQLIDYTMTNYDSNRHWMMSGMLGLEVDVEILWHKIRYIGDRSIDQRDLSYSPDEQKINQQALTDAVGNMSVNQGLFPNLEEVRLRGQDIRSGFVAAWSIEPILLNPNLKTLRTFGVDWYMGGKQKFVWPTHQSNLECLDLQETVIDADTLKSIMTRCPKLKSLSIDWADIYQKATYKDAIDQALDRGLNGYMDRSNYGSDDDDDDDYDQDSPAPPDPVYDIHVDLTGFGDVLREHGRDLEELAVSTFNYKNTEFESYCEGYIGTLRDFTKLKHLKIDCHDLLGVDNEDFIHGPRMINELGHVLPTSIETLYLYNEIQHPGTYWEPGPCNTETLVKEFLAEAETCAPNLRKVVVEWYESKYEWKEICKTYWSRETIDDGWDVQFIEEKFEVEFCDEQHKMALVVLTKKDKRHH